jgi:hypothetical protein
MKPITPLQGFNVRIVPLCECTKGRNRYCPNHVSGANGRPLATEQFGARGYCAACAFELRAYSRSKPCVDETRGAAVSLRPEGCALEVTL